MQKFLFILFLFISTTNISLSQTELFDANLTDIYGNSYSIFDELSQDKVIVFDFYGYTCGVCQGNSPRVDSVWQNNGGGDSVWVWGIETIGVDSAMIEDFAATYGTSFPNFSTKDGINVLTVEPHVNLYDMFAVGGTPRYIVVCPNREWRRYPVDSIQYGIDDCRNNPLGIVNNEMSVNRIKNIKIEENIYIEYYAEENSIAKIILYDILGKPIRVEERKYFNAENNIVLDKTQINTGIYILKFIVDNQEIETRKILINDR